MRKNKILLPWLLETSLISWKTAIEEAHMYTLDEIDTQFASKWLSQILWKRITKYVNLHAQNKTWNRSYRFCATFKMSFHSYPTRFSSVNYSNTEVRLSKTRFRIPIRGPAIWNNFVDNTEKELESISLFKSKVKNKFLDFENEVTFF